MVSVVMVSVVSQLPVASLSPKAYRKPAGTCPRPLAGGTRGVTDTDDLVTALAAVVAGVFFFEAVA